ncbi:MAG: hypothetical protein AAFN65_04165 [Bacteroidota bacterium]
MGRLFKIVVFLLSIIVVIGRFAVLKNQGRKSPAAAVTPIDHIVLTFYDYYSHKMRCGDQDYCWSFQFTSQGINNTGIATVQNLANNAVLDTLSFTAFIKPDTSEVFLNFKEGTINCDNCGCAFSFNPNEAAYRKNITTEDSTRENLIIRKIEIQEFTIGSNCKP